uniref:Uncharacterized protein n=1 Tax=Branchiostoma floridae TaxID=7739 RepID=C3YQT6_BRAFL|eukprot:XP_002601430.1 hypothetical protein BRAFLDRAFT_81293 [Branchiostoma floridae]
MANTKGLEMDDIDVIVQGVPGFRRYHTKLHVSHMTENPAKGPELSVRIKYVLVTKDLARCRASTLQQISTTIPFPAKKIMRGDNSKTKTYGDIQNNSGLIVILIAFEISCIERRLTAVHVWLQTLDKRRGAQRWS